MRMEFEVESIDGLGQEAIDQLRPKAAAQLRDVGKYMVNAFKKEVGRKGPGRAIASAPGEPPMTETGAYQRAFGRRLVNKKSKPYVEVQIGNRLWHTLGRFLNYGTRNMQPRPHIEPVVQREANNVERMLADL